MKKLLLIFTLLAISTQLAQAQEKQKPPIDERSSGENLYQPIPQIQFNPNEKSRWWVTVTKPTQYYYTKKGIVSYRYTQSQERVGSILEGYMGPRSAAIVTQGDNVTNSGSSIRTYANVSNRNQQGVIMAPRTEMPAKPVDKTKRSVRSAETTVQLAQQR